MSETNAEDGVATTAVVKAGGKPATQTVRQTDELPLTDAAKMLMASGLVKSNEDLGKIAAKISFGRSIGLGDVAAINGIGFTPNGGLILSAALMLSLIKRSGKYRVVYKQRTDKVCEIEVWEKIDGEWMTCGSSCSFSWEDAVRAKLSTKQTYAMFPKQMLTARCIADVFRTHCADCSSVACYTPEELPDSGYRTDPETMEMIPEAEVVSRAAPRAAPKAAKPAAAAADTPLARARSLLAATNTDERKAAAYYKADSVEQLSKGDLEDLVQKLEQKARAQK